MSKAAEVEAVKARIRSEPSFALRVFKAIHAAQKPEEQFTLRHKGHDGKGFRESETFALNKFYEQLEDQSWMMTPAQMEYLQERTVPYAGQFLRLNAEETEERREELKTKRKDKPKVKSTYRRMTPGEVARTETMLARMSD